MFRLRLRDGSGYPRRTHLRPLGFFAPHITLGLHCLNAGVQVPSVDSGLHKQVLGGGELLTQFGVLVRESEEQGRQVIAHPGRAPPQGNAFSRAQAWLQSWPC